MTLFRRARPLMLARLLSALVTFVIPLVLARVLTPTEYGTYKQAWLVVVTLYFVLQLGLTQSLYYFMPREPEKRHGFAAQAVVGLTFVGALAAVAQYLATPWLVGYFGNPALTQLAGPMAFVTFFMIAGSPFDIALTADGRITSAAIARVACDAARAIGMVLPVWYLRSLEGLFIGLAAASAIRFAGACVVAWPGRHAMSWAGLRQQLLYAIPFGAAIALAIPQQQFHNYAVGAYATAAAFAVYSVGAFQLPIVDLLYTPISEVLQLGIAESDRAGRRGEAVDMIRGAIAQLAFVFVPVAVFLFAAAPGVIALLFTERYLAAAPIYRVGLLAIPFAALPLEGVLRARAQRRFFLTVSGAKLLVTMPLVLGLLAWVGPIGAMAGYVVSEAFGKLWMLRRVALLFTVPVAEVLPARKLGAYLFAALLASPAAYFLAEATLLGGRFVALLAAGVAFCVVYLLGLGITGQLKLDELRRMRWASRSSATTRRLSAA